MGGKRVKTCLNTRAIILGLRGAMQHSFVVMGDPVYYLCNPLFIVRRNRI